MFEHRIEAGRQLAGAVAALGLAAPVVLGLPRGGVPVAAEVARALDAPLDLILVRKLGVPGHEELAAGAVGEGDPPVVVLNPHVMAITGGTEADFREKIAAKAREIAARRQLYLGGRARVPVRGRTVVVVDDGIATGATVRAALQVLRSCEPARLVLAVPVSPDDTLHALRGEVDDLICLEVPRPFHAVGAHYRDFTQVTDAEVVALLAR